MVIEMSSLNNTWYYDNTTIQQEYVSQLTSIYQYINQSVYSDILKTGVWVDYVPGDLLFGLGDTVNQTQFDEIKSQFAAKSDDADDDDNVTFSCSTSGANEYSVPSWCQITYPNAWINLDKAIRYFTDVNVFGKSQVTYVEKNGVFGDGDEVLAVRSDERTDDSGNDSDYSYYEWNLTFIEKSGDCPSGCLFSKSSSLSVWYLTNGSVIIVNGYDIGNYNYSTTLIDSSIEDTGELGATESDDDDSGNSGTSAANSLAAFSMINGVCLTFWILCMIF